VATTLTERADPGGAGDKPEKEPASAIAQAGEQRSKRLESVRALAAIGVVTAHILTLGLAYKGLVDTYPKRVLFGGGQQGLQLFFTMSGFLLFLPFVRHQVGLSKRPIDLRRYARNRMLRILPLYFTMVTVLIAIGAYGIHRGDMWRYYLFIQEYDGASHARLNAPMWSVAVEVQFYILLPLIALAIAKVCRRSLGRTALVLVAAGIVSFALRSTQVLHTSHPNIIGPVTGKYALSTLFYFFAGGMLLAVLHVAWSVRGAPAWTSRRVLGSSTAWIAAGVVVFFVTCWDVSWQEPWTQLSVFPIVAACVLPLRAGWATRLLEWRWLAAFGLTTFSVYLWHWPLLQAITGVHLTENASHVLTLVGDPMGFGTLWIIAMPVCAGVGIVSYFVIERPFLSKRRGWGATAATQDATKGDTPPAAPAGAAAA
jgi:peptidoglycan/LPS O-acetylase OafA/YrhL